VKWATAIGVLRLVVAALGVLALVGRFVYGRDFVTFSVGNYFGYLTHQSNIAAVVMFAAGGVAMLRGIREPGWASAARLLITSYLTVAGIVFGLLAAQAAERDYRLDVPWSDQLLHFWIPGLALADWILAPGRHRVSWRFSALVLGFPLVWGMFTMIRGSIVGWYPYFFLDPYQVASIGEFACDESHEYGVTGHRLQIDPGADGDLVPHDGPELRLASGAAEPERLLEEQPDAVLHAYSDLGDRGSPLERQGRLERDAGPLQHPERHGDDHPVGRDRLTGGEPEAHALVVIGDVGHGGVE
jgi:hypothetical protein